MESCDFLDEGGIGLVVDVLTDLDDVLAGRIVRERLLIPRLPRLATCLVTLRGTLAGPPRTGIRRVSMGFRFFLDLGALLDPPEAAGLVWSVSPSCGRGDDFDCRFCLGILDRGAVRTWWLLGALAS